MLRCRIAVLMVAGLIVASLPAWAASQRRPASRAADSQSATVERLNEESLQRARSGQNAPGHGPDTTSNLNRMSEGAAGRGQNENQAPMPFR